MADIKDADARNTFHWEDATKGENVMYRVPQNIRWNDNVVVREDEYAVFFRDGKSMAVFDQPGRFSMTTENVPVLASIAKAITWRIIASGTTFIISFIIFRQVTNMKLSEVLETSTYVTIIDIIAKLIFYYLHERMWTNIKWGKYWKRHYWRRRAWRKMYRDKHNQNKR